MIWSDLSQDLSIFDQLQIIAKHKSIVFQHRYVLLYFLYNIKKEVSVVMHSDYTKWIFGLYAAGNVGEHVAKK